MVDIRDKNMCMGCFACATACPTGCIKMTADEEGFFYPKADVSRCINCGKCDRVCVMKNPRQIADRKITAYACYNKKEELIKKSSSGAMFSILANYVLKDGGTVFGVELDENLNPHEAMAFVPELRDKNKASDTNIDENTSADTADGKDKIDSQQIKNAEAEAVHLEEKTIDWPDYTDYVKKMRGSKYVQSRMDNAYELCRQELEANRKVLFSGTPCQIEGLYSYLNKEYKKLITQDIICHGTPSPKAWQYYLRYREKKAGAKAVSVSFRNKKLGWEVYSLEITFANGEVYNESMRDDPFMKSFHKNLCLRPACYSCPFKTAKKNSDFTLADFWGISMFYPELKHDTGTSLVLAHSWKARKIMEKVAPFIECTPVEAGKALKKNASIRHSAKCPDQREWFMKNVNEDNYPKLIKEFLKEIEQPV